MAEGIEAFIQGARMARQIAEICLLDAHTADDARSEYFMREYERHIERAEWYEDHAQMMIARQERIQAEMQEAAQ